MRPLHMGQGEMMPRPIATEPTAQAWLDVEAQLHRIAGTSMQETAP